MAAEDKRSPSGIPIDPVYRTAEVDYGRDLAPNREKTDFAYGWNAQTGEYGDLYNQGVIDPAKVTRSALQNAASIAALMLTTEALVADKPEKEPAMPAMPGGGMGGMGGMGMM